jgi:hypothetical protein
LLINYRQRRVLYRAWLISQLTQLIEVDLLLIHKLKVEPSDQALLPLLAGILPSPRLPSSSWSLLCISKLVDLFSPNHGDLLNLFILHLEVPLAVEYFGLEPLVQFLSIGLFLHDEVRLSLQMVDHRRLVFAYLLQFFDPLLVEVYLQNVKLNVVG